MDGDTAIAAGQRCSRLLHFIQIKVDIPRNKEIQIPITVKVKKGTAGIPHRLALRTQSCLLGDIGECPVPVISIKHILTVVSNKDILISVIVVISNRH